MMTRLRGLIERMPKFRLSYYRSIVFCQSENISLSHFEVINEKNRSRDLLPPPRNTPLIGCPYKRPKPRTAHSEARRVVLGYVVFARFAISERCESVLFAIHLLLGTVFDEHKYRKIITSSCVRITRNKIYIYWLSGGRASSQILCFFFFQGRSVFSVFQRNLFLTKKKQFLIV